MERLNWDLKNLILGFVKDEVMHREKLKKVHKQLRADLLVLGRREETTVMFIPYYRHREADLKAKCCPYIVKYKDRGENEFDQYGEDIEEAMREARRFSPRENTIALMGDIYEDDDPRADFSWAGGDNVIGLLLGRLPYGERYRAMAMMGRGCNASRHMSERHLLRGSSHEVLQHYCETYKMRHVLLSVLNGRDCYHGSVMDHRGAEMFSERARLCGAYDD